MSLKLNRRGYQEIIIILEPGAHIFWLLIGISEAVNILIGIQVDHSLYFLPFIVEAGQKELPFPHHQ